MCTEARAKSRGFTLVEAILAIVIVSVALTGVLLVFQVTTQHSADPMVQQQAQFIAEAYLDEILRQKFFDPELDKVCTGTSAGETRATYDNVCDYDALANNPPQNQFGSPLALSGYGVAVSVASTGVQLNNIDNATVPRVLRVDVTVSGPTGTGVSITLSGYRTNYACNATGNPGCKSL